MKHPSFRMGLCALVIASSAWANNVSRSFLSIRPYTEPMNLNSYQLLSEAKSNGWVLEMNSVQFSVFGGASTNSKDLAQYFMFNNKSTLLVKNTQDSGNGGVTIPGQQDVLAAHFNFDPLGNATYVGTISFAPKHTFAGGSMTFKAYLPHHLYLELGIPVVWVKNDMHLTENIITSEVVDGTQVWLDGQSPVSTMIDGFKRPGMQYGKIDGSRSSAGFGDVLVKFGYDPVLLNRKDLHVTPYAGFILPSSNRPKGVYVFEPIRGNGAHWAVMGGGQGELLVKQMNHGQLWLQSKIEGQYLFRNTQKRSFDLLLNGGWSRYLSMFPDVNAVTNDTTNHTTRVSGINLMTRDAIVKPGFQLTYDLALSYVGHEYYGTFGWIFHALQGEDVSLLKPWTLGPQLASLSTPDDTNPYSFIGNALTAQNDETGFPFIQASDIDYDSAARPAVMTNVVEFKLGRYCQKTENPVLCEVGSSFETSKFNAAINRWSVWGMVNVAF